MCLSACLAPSGSFSPWDPTGRVTIARKVTHLFREEVVNLGSWKRLYVELSHLRFCRVAKTGSAGLAPRVRLLYWLMTWMPARSTMCSLTTSSWW